MYDNQIYQVIIPIITAGLTAQGLSDVVVVQDSEPTQQGAALARAVYLQKLFNNPYGFPEEVDVWNAIDNEMDHTSDQWDEAHFQASTLVTENPADDSALTGSDLANITLRILQSRSTIATLNSAGLGILRISAVPNPFFTNDRDVFQSSAHFDFVITNSSPLASISPTVNDVQFNIYRV
jgi:E217 gateway protein gp29